MSKPIKVDIYTYTARRVYLYAQKPYDKLLRPFTLKRKEYDFYAESVLNVIDTIKSLNLEDEIDFRVRPWYLWFWRATAHGGFKPPVVIIDGHLFSKGKVPDVALLKAKLSELEQRETFLRR